MGMKHRTPCKQIFCPFTHPWMGSKGQNIFYEELVMLHIKLQGKSLEHYASKMFDCMLTPDGLGMVKGSDIEIVQINI